MKKTRIACLLAGFILLPSAHTASHDAHAGHGALSVPSAPVAPAESALVDGVVKKIDKAGGKVTVTHGPLVNLNMSRPMTMVFRVKDLSWLDQMQVDGRIRFVADSIGGILTIVHFETVK
jgi:Cu/Ag efflux protein CusF